MEALSLHNVTLSEFTKSLKSEIGSGTAVIAPKQKMTKKVKLVKKKKKKKDPNAPTKGKSAYLFFCAAMRPQLKEAGVTGKDVMVKLGVMWNEPTLDKGPYNEMATADKIRYAAEMKAYVAPVVEDI
tara:strand:- start:349 stop:729 length:381 start_codon:yes stop_codon:yes gene_type:complete